MSAPNSAPPEKGTKYSSGKTTIFLRDLIRDVDIGIHDHEIGRPQSLRSIWKCRFPVQNPQLLMK